MHFKCSKNNLVKLDGNLFAQVYLQLYFSKNLKIKKYIIRLVIYIAFLYT